MLEEVLCLLWFCFTPLSDWLKKFTPLSRPIRLKTKTNREFVALVFLSFDRFGVFTFVVTGQDNYFGIGVTL